MESHKENPVTSASFVCSFCDVDFISNEELMLHLQYHNATKPYFCTECDNRYMNKSGLKRHVATHGNEELKFNCNKCDYTCDNKRNLTNHVFADSSDKPFICKKCDYRTIQMFLCLNILEKMDMVLIINVGIVT